MYTGYLSSGLSPSHRIRISISWVLAFLFAVSDAPRRRKRASSLVVSKRKRKLLPYGPSEDPVRRMEQMASLATALTATGAKFSDKLTYVPGMAPRSANRASLEHGGMQVIF